MQSFKNTEDALKALSLGQAFAYIGPIKVTATLINKNGYVNLKASAPSSLPDGFAQMGLRNDWPELQSIINKVLNSIPPDEKSQIINKWTPIKFDHGISSDDVVKWILISVGSVLVILMFFVAWNWHLRVQVRIRTADVIDSEKRFRVTFEQAAVGIAHVAQQASLLPAIAGLAAAGNAGILAAGHMPLALPGLAMKALRWMFEKDSPLYIRPRLDLPMFR